MERTEQLGDWFPGTTVDSDELFPRQFERLGLVLKGGQRASVTFHQADPDVLRGIGIVSGAPVAVAWTEIDLILFFDRPKH